MWLLPTPTFWKIFVCIHSHSFDATKVGLVRLPDGLGQREDRIRHRVCHHDQSASVVSITAQLNENTSKALHSMSLSLHTRAPLASAFFPFLFIFALALDLARRDTRHCTSICILAFCTIHKQAPYRLACFPLEKGKKRLHILLSLPSIQCWRSSGTSIPAPAYWLGSGHLALSFCVS